MRNVKNTFRSVLAILPVLFALATMASCEELEGFVNKGGSGTGSSDEPVATSVEIYKGNALVSSVAGSQFVLVSASGDWTLSLSTSDEGDWATITPSSGVGEKRNVILSYDENKGEDARIVSITLTCGKDTASCSLTQKGKGNAAGSGGNNGQAVSQQGWMELPATSESDGLDFFVTNMTFGGKTFRNMSYYWDYTNFVSHWVAYPLNKALRGSGGRSNAWGLDPNLPESKQSNITMRGFNPSSTYARGHQCPSADRLCNEAANAQTFYGTNMTPQMHTFNEGVWANLESKVRQWCDACDTLYVVTGCVVAPNSINGAKGEVGGYALDNVGAKVAIPTQYYKAVLRYQKNSTYGYNGYCGLAVILDHSASAPAVTKSSAISIDKLEELTGVDFFVNLASAIGEENAARVEAQDPQSVGIWW